MINLIWFFFSLRIFILCCVIFIFRWFVGIFLRCFKIKLFKVCGLLVGSFYFRFLLMLWILVLFLIKKLLLFCGVILLVKFGDMDVVNLLIIFFKIFLSVVKLMILLYLFMIKLMCFLLCWNLSSWMLSGVFLGIK